MPLDPGQPTVRPRVRSLDVPEGQAVLLEDAFEPYLGAAVANPVCVALCGRCGSGKTTALARLSARFGDAAAYLDQPSIGDLLRSRTARPTVYTAQQAPLASRHVARFELEPWSADDVLEHLLAVAPERCGELYPALVQDPFAVALEGNPELWTAVVDELLRLPAPRCLARVLQHRLQRTCGSPERRRMAARAASAVIHGAADASFQLWSRVATEHGHAPGDPLLRHRAARVLVVRDLFAAELRAGRCADEMAERLHPELAVAIGRRIAGSARARATLVDVLLRHATPGTPADHRPGNAAAILHGADPRWLLRLHDEARGSGPRIVVRHAELPGLQAPGIASPHLSFHHCNLQDARLGEACVGEMDLMGSDLRGADLAGLRAERLDARGARLAGANLLGAEVQVAILTQADLRASVLRGARLGNAGLDDADLTDVDLSAADLSGANLIGATLERALLHHTVLAGAMLLRADLRTARMEDVDLTGASLAGAKLHGVRLPAARLALADLSGADLSESDMPRADLLRANLAETGLAGVRWRGADLRGANLTRATFHYGASRSGLIPGGYPSQGTRTGFYTDEQRDLEFKEPDAVRRADLRDVNLHGAKIEATDFYLVDLRGALYDRRQAAHLRRTGAML